MNDPVSGFALLTARLSAIGASDQDGWPRQDAAQEGCIRRRVGLTGRTTRSGSIPGNWTAHAWADLIR